MKIEGEGLTAVLDDATINVVVTESLDAAPSVAWSFHDAKGEIINSGLFDGPAVCQPNGVNTDYYELVGVSKAGYVYTATFESIVTTALRRHDWPRKALPNTVTRTQFARALVEEEPWITFVSPFWVREPLIKTELSRGSTSSEAPESTWDALGRMAAEVGYRRWVRGTELWWMSDEQLFLSDPVMDLVQYQRGVDFIDYDFDIANPIVELTVECRVGFSDGVLKVGDCVWVDQQGPVTGKYLVSEIVGSEYGVSRTLTLRKPSPQLPEPTGTGGSGAVSVDTGLPVATGVARGVGSTAGSGSGGSVQLVSIGQGGHRLRPDAAKALAAAENMVGRPIRVTDSFRTRAQQEEAYRRKPHLAARPGTSKHELGIAIDIVEMQAYDIQQALTKTGWFQFNRRKEPWHWSYGVVG